MFEKSKCLSAIRPHERWAYFGQGFGLALTAAANPDIAFEGCDFNPGHVAHARGLIERAELGNVVVSEASFEEAAAHGRANNIDLVILHEIMSWVGRSTQDAIISILRQRLQPDGLAYVSYNCMPGWAPIAPVRQLMSDHSRRHPGSSRQVAMALEFLSRLKQANAGYFTANPATAQHLDSLHKLDSGYVAHEYFCTHWELFHFSQMVARLDEAKLSFVASATLLENLDQHAVPGNIRPLLNEIDDPIFRETVRDFAVNKRFRRDIFARGNAVLTATEKRQNLSALSFVLAMPRGRINLKFTGPLWQMEAREEIYIPLLDALAERVIGFDELLHLPHFGVANIGTLLDCLTLLVNSGQVHAVSNSLR